MSELTKFEEQILLSVWKLGDNAYGTTISKHIHEITGKKLSLGGVYFPLDRLVKNGFLTSRLSESTPERGGRRKRIYRLTPEGFEALEKARDVQVRMWEHMPGELKES